MRLGFVAAFAALVCAVADPVQAQDTADRAPPRLIVTIVVDQFSANLFNQYRSRWTGGLRRLADEGLVSTNGYQTHGLTETCPGHSTVLTGMHPAQTGIPSNDWIDPATGEEVYCLAAPANTLAHGRNSDNGPVGPDNVRATSLGDWVKDQKPGARVFAVSGKDRGAINLAGHRPDGAYWFTDGFGLTTYVEPGQNAQQRLAAVEAFNIDFRRRQTATPHAWTYSQPQCRTLEADWAIGDDVLHSTVPPAQDDFDSSPSLDEETLKAAAYLLDSQRLGQGPNVDLLGVSLSATDRIGHAYGTQGPEMCEQMHRLDQALGAFLARLETVPGGVIVVLTADHGGSDFVERLARHGAPHAHRIDSSPLSALNTTLKERFNLDASPLQSESGGWAVADKSHKALPEPLRSQIIEAALPLLREMPDIVFVEARDRLLVEPLPVADQPELLTLRERMRLSVVADRSPDIIMVRAPNATGKGRVGGNIAGHGTPWDYDRRVPIIFWRPGATTQERFLPIRTIDIAPTLAAAIGVETPAVSGHALPLWEP
ncbi:alkaline phosphatase family protein [Brevundimonas faecalis]|uniref:AlkP superfamily pyrophosphatase or phosphodiesterase n=1 Tax=Brevundimonas faecalis TaxID=947378 RepID=A0ABV2RFA3_9CAUL